MADKAGKNVKFTERMVVTRHSTLERLAHYANIISLPLLLISGFIIYLGLPYLSYSDAYAINIISAAVFLSVNWVLIPYNAFVNMSLSSYMFWPADFKRLWGVIKNFFTGSEYPLYTIYDMGKHRFINRLHPVTKLLVYSHYVALFIFTITEILLYSSPLSFMSINFSTTILKVMDILEPSFNLSGMGLAMILHVATFYWFIAEVIIHVGMHLDPRKAQHIKSMFIDGKEDLLADPTADIVNTSMNAEEFEEKTAIKIK
jgi:cytochrome b subunit of formate dehydrogenase